MVDAFGHELKVGDKVIWVFSRQSSVRISYKYVVAMSSSRVKVADNLDSSTYSYVTANRCIRVASIEVDDDAQDN